MVAVSENIKINIFYTILYNLNSVEVINLKQILKLLVLFVFGGTCYYSIEMLWRGYSHIAMFFLGGLCFLFVGWINNNYFTSKNNFLTRLLVSSLVITGMELMFGMIFNMRLGLNIWDYGSMRFNLMGQISIGYSILWFFLSLPIIFSYDYLNYWIFGEEKPNYKIIELK